LTNEGLLFKWKKNHPPPINPHMLGNLELNAGGSVWPLTIFFDEPKLLPTQVNDLI
jgi:hypothetical protein